MIIPPIILAQVRVMNKCDPVGLQLRPELAIDGEMQADVALDPGRRTDWSFCAFEGRANVLIFPNLDAGNIAYKLLETFGGAQAVGPILLGMRKPVTVLQRGSSVETIVHMAAITVATARRIATRA